MVDKLNAIAWILSNLLIGYIALALVIFVIAYVILFDPKATTAGKYIFRFFVSLVGVIGLVFIATFVDPAQGREWNVYPGDILWWRPTVRLISYGYVACTVTGLSILLGVRKFRPDLLRTVHEKELVKPRNTKE
jgi:ABC-type transport system involved in cytochrome c biogenesis permease subunit